MTGSRKVRDHRAYRDLAVAGVFGMGAAFLVNSKMMDRIDEMLVTFMSIVVAAAIPGIALTAAAPRPASSSPLEARRFGAALAEQVSFWFGYLWTGCVAVGLLIAGKALEWKLTFIPRPAFVPNWVPDGGAWLVFVAVAATVFVTIRTRHIVTAVQSIIQVGTDVNSDQAAERHKEIHNEIAAELARTKVGEGRGDVIEGRQRH